MKNRMVGVCLMLLVASPGMAQDAPRVQPRIYRVVLENDRVRVLDFVSRPAMGMCGTGMHSHPDHVTVLLSPSLVRITLPNGQTQVVSGKEGDTFYEPAITHEVENISGHDAHALLIELKQPRPR